MPKKGYKQTEEHKRNIQKSQLGEKNHFYGKHHTKATRVKISNNRKGKYAGESHWLYKKGYLIEGEKNGNYGENENLKEEKNPFYKKKHTKETIKKLRNINLGKTLSEETKNKISIKLIGTNCGENNPAWKGGVSGEPYCEQWLDQDYKESIKERDDYKCLNPECNKTTNKLCIHHINYDKKNCHPSNLITVCFSCNSKANKNRKWHKAWYQAIIYQRYNILSPTKSV